MSDKLTPEEYEAVKALLVASSPGCFSGEHGDLIHKVVPAMLERRKPDPPPVQFHAAAFFVNPCDATRSRLWDALRVDHGWGIMAIRGQPILIRALPEDEFGRKAIAIA